MEKKFIFFTIVTLLVLLIFGCYAKEASIIMKGIQIQPAKLPPGSRILVCETSPGMVNYEIKRFRKKITLQGLIVVEPPSSKYKGALLPEVVKQMVGDLSVDMVFVAFVTVKNAFYKKNETGQYELSDEMPIAELMTNKNALILENITKCSVYQYDKNGKLMGYTIFTKPIPEKIYIDNYKPPFINYGAGKDFKEWLQKNISAD